MRRDSRRCRGAWCGRRSWRVRSWRVRMCGRSWRMSRRGRGLSMRCWCRWCRKPRYRYRCGRYQWLRRRCDRIACCCNLFCNVAARKDVCHAVQVIDRHVQDCCAFASCRDLLFVGWRWRRGWRRSCWGRREISPSLINDRRLWRCAFASARSLASSALRCSSGRDWLFTRTCQRIACNALPRTRS